jgi:hypothetical protein
MRIFLLGIAVFGLLAACGKSEEEKATEAAFKEIGEKIGAMGEAFENFDMDEALRIDLPIAPSPLGGNPAFIINDAAATEKAVENMFRELLPAGEGAVKGSGP